MSALNNINKQELLEYISSTQMKTNVPNFGPGDTIVVHNKITEGSKTRIQKFEGLVLRRRGKGISETFLVRKESNGIWLERTFQVHSPLIDKIELIRQGKVRRAYLTYMRKRSGKSARIKEKK
ncbi:MAG: 50S ribosomal protein L19 [Malacoplasma sp.]